MLQDHTPPLRADSRFAPTLESFQNSVLKESSNCLWYQLGALLIVTMLWPVKCPGYTGTCNRACQRQFRVQKQEVARTGQSIIEFVALDCLLDKPKESEMDGNAWQLPTAALKLPFWKTAMFPCSQVVVMRW